MPRGARVRALLKCARPLRGASGTSASRRWRAVSAVTRGAFVSPHCHPVDTGRPLNLAVALCDRPCSDRDDDESSALKPASKEAPAATAPKSSWVHTVSSSTSRSSEGKPRAPRGYEPLARNPLYCGAEHSAAWELRHLSQHHHPTVALFASRVLSGRPVAYPGDPLQDFTLSRFLDRFVYRNPKKVAPPDEYKEKDLAGNVFGKRRQYVPTGARKMHVLSREYMGQDVSRIPPEEQYLYRYFQQTGGLKEKKKKKVEEEDESEAESVASDDVEAVLNLCEPGVDGELDFAGDFVAAKGKKKHMKSGDGSDESDDDGDLDEDEDDDVDLAGLEDDEEYKQALEELNIGKGNAIREEDIEFSDEDEFGDAGSSKGKGKPGRPKDKSFNKSGLLASAEQFSHLLDENAAAGVDTTSAQALSNKDKASAKQLKWEMNRDAWVRGHDWRSRKRKFGGSGKRGGKAFGKKKVRS